MGKIRNGYNLSKFKRSILIEKDIAKRHESKNVRENAVKPVELAEVPLKAGGCVGRARRGVVESGRVDHSLLRESAARFSPPARAQADVALTVVPSIAASIR